MSRRYPVESRRKVLDLTEADRPVELVMGRLGLTGLVGDGRSIGGARTHRRRRIWSIGNYYVNGQMGSFWERMQADLLNRKRWNTRPELANAMFENLELFHISHRRHPSPGTPDPADTALRRVNWMVSR